MLFRSRYTLTSWVWIWDSLYAVHDTGPQTYCDVFVFRRIIIVGSGSDDWILLAVQLHPFLVTLIPIALSLFHTFNNHCSQQSTQSISSSLHLQLLTPWTLNYTDFEYDSSTRTILLALWFIPAITLYWLAALRRSDYSLSTCHSLAQYQLYCLNYTDSHTDCIQLGRSTDIVSEHSERTRRKHRLRRLFYCRVTYTS
jgi:hypothetical protein